MKDINCSKHAKGFSLSGVVNYITAHQGLRRALALVLCAVILLGVVAVGITPRVAAETAPDTVQIDMSSGKKVCTDYIFFDLAAGEITITDTIATGYVYNYDGDLVKYSVPHHPSNKYYIIQSPGTPVEYNGSYVGKTGRARMYYEFNEFGNVIEGKQATGMKLLPVDDCVVLAEYNKDGVNVYSAYWEENVQWWRSEKGVNFYSYESYRAKMDNSRVQSPTTVGDKDGDGTPNTWADYTYQNTDVVSVIESFEGQAVNADRVPTAHHVEVRGASDFDITVDNLWSSYQAPGPKDASAGYDARTAGGFSFRPGIAVDAASCVLRTRGDNRFGCIDYSSYSTSNANYLIACELLDVTYGGIYRETKNGVTKYYKDGVEQNLDDNQKADFEWAILHRNAFNMRHYQDRGDITFTITNMMNNGYRWSSTATCADIPNEAIDVENDNYFHNLCSAAIGGADYYADSARGIVIDGGSIYAGTTVGDNATAIGGGGNGEGQVTIKAGDVTAVCHSSGAAIGGGVGSGANGGSGFVTIEETDPAVKTRVFAYNYGPYNWHYSGNGYTDRDLYYFSRDVWERGVKTWEDTNGKAYTSADENSVYAQFIGENLYGNFYPEGHIYAGLPKGSEGVTGYDYKGHYAPGAAIGGGGSYEMDASDITQVDITGGTVIAQSVGGVGIGAGGSAKGYGGNCSQRVNDGSPETSTYPEWTPAKSGYISITGGDVTALSYAVTDHDIRNITSYGVDTGHPLNDIPQVLPPSVGIGGGTGRLGGGSATVEIGGTAKVVTGSIGGGEALKEDALIGSADVTVSGSANVHGQVIMAAGAETPCEFNMTGGTIDNAIYDANGQKLDIHWGDYVADIGVKEPAAGLDENSDPNFGRTTGLSKMSTAYILDIDGDGKATNRVWFLRNSGGAVYIENGSATISGGTIKNCAGSNGGAVYISGTSATGEKNKVTMSGGYITSCYAYGDWYESPAYSTGHGGAVYISKGNFQMTGGVINYNGSIRHGGGVYVADGDVSVEQGCGFPNWPPEANVNPNEQEFYMASGRITLNYASGMGGGICVNNGNAVIGYKPCRGEDASHIHPVIQSNTAIIAGGGIAVVGGWTRFYCGQIVKNACVNDQRSNSFYERNADNVGEIVDGTRVPETHFDVYGGELDVGVLVESGIFHDQREGSYNITYHANHDGTETGAMQESIAGGYLTMPAPEDVLGDFYDNLLAQIPEGMSFLGWSTTPDQKTGVIRVGEVVPITNNVDFYTVFVTPDNYTITYVVPDPDSTDGADVSHAGTPNNYVVNPQDDASVPLTPATSATTTWAFTGWKLTAVNTGTQGDNGNWTLNEEFYSTLPTGGRYGNITLTAQWTKVEGAVGYYYYVGQDSTDTSYTNWTFAPAGAGVTNVNYLGYNPAVDTGFTPNNPLYFVGADLPLTLKAPSRVGYTFLGWREFGELPMEQAPVLTQAAPYAYASYWQANTYILTFDANGGTVNGQPNHTVNYTIEDAFSTAPDPVREGYTFTGWKATAVAGSWKLGVDYPAADTKGHYGNVTFTAQWTPDVNDLTIKFSHTAPDQSLIFDVSGELLKGGTLTMQVAGVADTDTDDDGVEDGGQIVIKNVPVGTYTVTGHGDWRWRFTVSEALDPVTSTATAEDAIEDVTKAKVDHAVSFAHTKTNNKWLNDYHTTKGNTAPLELTDMGEYEITYYWGADGAQSANPKYYELIAAAGFTSIPLENGSVEQNKTALELIKNNGLTCAALMDGRIRWLDYSKSYTQDEIDDLVATVIQDYADYLDVIKGWWLFDEANRQVHADTLKQVVDAFRRLDPTREVFIDLLPQWGMTWISDFGSGTDQQKYQNYLSAFVDQADPLYICYNLYPFIEDRPDSDQSIVTNAQYYSNIGPHRTDFFENLEIIRAKGKATGKDYMIINQLTEHWWYANVSPAMLAWQVNMGLAYGTKRTSYFTAIINEDIINQNRIDNNNVFVEEDFFENALIGEPGAPQSAGSTTTNEGWVIYEHYAQVSNINKWLLPLGNELFERTSTGVYHLLGDYEAINLDASGKKNVLETGCTAYPDNANVLAQTKGLGDLTGNKDLVVGFYDDGSFMLVNKKYWTNSAGDAAGSAVAGLGNGDNTITLNSHSDPDALQYFNTTTAKWEPLSGCTGVDVVNGKVTITLGAGCAVYLRPAN